ncbi:MAG: DUF6249 domain-containing protein [Bacteroidota bacterium]
MQTIYIIFWLAFIICLFFVWFFSHRANHKERLMMIEKGIDAEEQAKRKDRSGFSWLKLGILVIGLSVGLLIITILVSLNLLDKGGNALPLAILGLCGGTAMVIANTLGSSKSKD